jgi:hypothetical protein
MILIQSLLISDIIFEFFKNLYNMPYTGFDQSLNLFQSNQYPFYPNINQYQQQYNPKNFKTVSWKISAYANKNTNFVQRIKSKFASFDEEMYQSDDFVRILNNGKKK